MTLRFYIIGMEIAPLLIVVTSIFNNTYFLFLFSNQINYFIDDSLEQKKARLGTGPARPWE